MDTPSPFHYNATEGDSWEVAVIDVEVIWDRDDDPDGNVEPIAEPGVTVEEVEEVLRDTATRSGKSRRWGRRHACGWPSTGNPITVIWEEVCNDPRTIDPVTA